MSLDPSNRVDLAERADSPAPHTPAEWQLFVTLNNALRPLRDPIEIQEVAARVLGEHLGANRVLYAEIHGDQFIVRRSYLSGVAPVPAERGPITSFGASLHDLVKRGETIVIDDVRGDARFTEQEQEAFLAAEIAAFVGVMLHKGGRLVAAFGVHSAAPRVWTRDQVALIEGVGERAWAAVERQAAENALRSSEEHQAFLLRLSDVIRPLGDPTRILSEACRLLGVHLRVNRVTYGEIDGDDCTVLGDYVDGVASIAGRFRWTNMGGSRAEQILRGGILVINDTASDLYTESEREAQKAAEIGASLTPILIKDGRFVAAFGIHHRTPRVWTPDEILLAQEVADRIWSTLEQRKAEMALRANEERLQFLLRLNDALGPLSDPYDVQETAARLLGEHLGVNRVGYAEIHGSEYIIHREYARGVAPLTGRGPAATFGAALRDAYRRGETVVVKNVHADPRFTDAERVNLQAREIAAFIGVTLIKGGQLVAAFGANNATPRDWTRDEIVLIREVGERTWDAAERARAETALREREQRLRLALDASDAGTWTWDARTNHIDWDETFRVRYGFGPDEPPAFESWLGRVHDEDRSQVLALLNEMLQTTKAAWDNAFRIVKPDGTMSWIQSLGRADRDSNGQVMRLTGLELDITAHRRAEEALQARLETALQERTGELEHRTEQLSQLASDLTLAEQRAREQLAKTLHDGLQQLLVLAALNLDQQVKRDTERGTSVESITQAKGHLDEAIAAARSLSFDLFPPFLQSSGLPAALTWLAEWTRNKYGLEVDVSVDPLANSTRQDVRTLLFESVRELLLNAVKHAQVERVAVDLTRDTEDRLCITVTDQGVGFDIAALVVRAKAGRVGWGLFSIRERLTLLGGRFDIESTPGQGTRFRLIAPRGVQETAGAQDPATHITIGPVSRATSSAVPAQVLKILIVDDHTAVRRVFRELLQERAELRVVGDAANGHEAIRQAHALRPDVILMDISMPEMDGVEATRRIRAELPFIQVLGLSMQPRSHEPHAIEQAGAAGYFTKGIDTQRLIDHLVVIHANSVIASPRTSA